MSSPYTEVSISTGLFNRYKEVHRQLGETMGNDDESARLVNESIQIRKDVFTEAWSDYNDPDTNILKLVE